MARVAKKKSLTSEDDAVSPVLVDAEDDSTKVVKKVKKETKPDVWPQVPQVEQPPLKEGEMILRTFNVNGIRACLRNGWVNQLSKEKVLPGVIVVQETKISKDDFHDVKEALVPFGYNVFSNTGTTPGYAGTAMFYQEAMKPIECVNDSQLAYVAASRGFFDKKSASSRTYASDTQLATVKDRLKAIGYTVTEDMRKQFWKAALEEGRIVTAEYEDYYLISSYVPNSGQKLERLDFRTTVWEPVLAEYLCILELQKPILYTGDLNVARTAQDIFDTKGQDKTAGFTPREREAAAKFYQLGFLDMYREVQPDVSGFTFWGYRFQGKEKNRGWRIDYWVASPALKDRIGFSAVGTEVVPEGGRLSDHAPLDLIFKYRKE